MFMISTFGAVNVIGLILIELLENVNIEIQKTKFRIKDLHILIYY